MRPRQRSLGCQREITCEAPRLGHVGCEWRIEVKLGIHYTVRLVHVLDPTPFRREKKKKKRTDTRSSWFPKHCCFGASPSVITIFSTHDGPSKNLSRLVCLCEHVCDTCLCVSACGWRAIRFVHHCFRCVR